MTDLKLPIHESYTETIDAVEQVRDAVEGSNRIKYCGTKYLPHPSQVDTTSEKALRRYRTYKLNAEFDNDTDDTRRELIGKMRISDTVSELPGKIEYLMDDIDGDGTTLNAAIESTVNEVLQVKFEVNVADYQGLSGVDLESISIADAKQLNTRAVVKKYTRENFVNWNFRRVNGAIKLAYMLLLERGTDFNPESTKQDEVLSYLILALDEEGYYYQQKVVYGGDGTGERSERDYQTVNGQRLDFIPATIICDEELPIGKVPKQLGYLYGISEKVLHRYRVSADYKECQKALLPTTYTQGWKTGDGGLFQELNGRKNLESGPYSVNQLPNNVTVQVESTQADMKDFHHYFEESKKQVSEKGGNSGAQSSNMTATEADIIATSQNALLNTIVDSVEDGYIKLLSYCAMFEGLVLPDDVNQYDDISVEMPRDFASPKMTDEEVKSLREIRMSGDLTQRQFFEMLDAGGRLIKPAEEYINELENDGGSLNLPDVAEGG